jgi:hypothetical protein
MVKKNAIFPSPLHILWGPTERVYPKDAPELSATWCRKCRQRTVHRYVNLCDKEPSYYGPTPAWECKECGQLR